MLKFANDINLFLTSNLHKPLQPVLCKLAKKSSIGRAWPRSAGGTGGGVFEGTFGLWTADRRNLGRRVFACFY